MKQRSRLVRQKTYQTKKSLVLSVVGIAFLIFMVFKFGYPLLVSFTGILVGVNAKDDTTNTLQAREEFIAPPVFDILATATNSAKIAVSGTATPDEEVQLWVNGKALEKMSVKKNGTFLYKEVTLREGENRLKAKTILGDKESEYSDTATILYSDEKPELTISSPHDNDTFAKDNQSIAVTGTTTPGMKITVNDFWAIVDDKGNFSYTLHLAPGENKIKVTATNDAGNTTSQELKVTYNQ